MLRYSDKQHLMLLYDDELQRSSAEIDCINQALASGQYCVYATIDASDKDFVSKLTLAITNYDRHIKEGDLIIVDFRPFYDGAARGDLTLFKQLKTNMEEALRKRMASGKNPKALIVADAACHLSRCGQFDECVTLEGWWQKTYKEWMAKSLDIAIICAHPSSVLKQDAYQRQQGRISDVHSLTLDAGDFVQKKSASSSNPSSKLVPHQPIRILIAEPEPDIQVVYKRYLKSLPVEIVTVQNGKECLEKALHSDKTKAYDVIIVDSHLKDGNWPQIARKMVEKLPDQYIVFTSTNDRRSVESEMSTNSLDIERYPILQKPFLFSQLLALVKPAKIRD